MTSVLIFTSLLLGSTVWAGFTVPLKGKITHIEKGQAVMVSAEGETRIPMADLSEEKKKKIFDASGSKKEVVIFLAPEVFRK